MTLKMKRIKNMWINLTQEDQWMFVILGLVVCQFLAYFLFESYEVDFLLLVGALLVGFFVFVFCLKFVLAICKRLGVSIKEGYFIQLLLGRVFYACWWYLLSVLITMPILLSWFVYKAKNMYYFFPKV